MLDLLRRKAQSPYLQATVLVIIVVFIFWGVGGQNSGALNAVATVNGESITLQEFDQAFQRTMDNYRNQFGGNLPKGFIESFNLKKQVVHELIQKSLLLQGGKEMGLYVSNNEIQNAIKEMTVFQNNGVFDATRYREVLKGSRLTPTKFEAGLQSDLLLSKVGASLAEFARVTPKELDDRFRFDNSETRLDYAVFKPEHYTGKVNVSDELLAQYFDKNKEKYMTPPQVKIKFLSFMLKDEMDKVTVPAEEIEQYYTSHQEEFGQLEKRRARHILLKTTEQDKQTRRAEMEKILARAKAGEDFSALARQFSEDGSAAQGGDLGFFSRGQMVQPFEDAVFSLSKGGVSDIVETPFGLHIISLEDIQPANITPLAGVKSAIENKLKKQQALNNAFEKANEAYEKIIFAGSLAKYAENFKVPLAETDFFPQTAPPSSLASNSAVIDTAFSLKKGELSSIIDSPEGYSVLFVEDRKEPAIPALAEVQQQVKKDFVEAEARTLCQKDAEETFATIRDGKDVDFLQKIQEKGLTVHVSGYFSRTKKTSKDLPQELITAGLTLGAGAPYPATVIAADNAFYICRFKDKIDAGDNDEQARKAFAARLAMEKQKEVMDAWIDYLTKSGKITINEKYLN
ncbi:MAG: SurA N-terminal domain-containing protein [Thermodesulfobacteriota bacterium]